MEFNTKFEEKRVGRSPQGILTPPTYINVLTIYPFWAQYEGKMELAIRYGDAIPATRIVPCR